MRASCCSIVRAGIWFYSECVEGDKTSNGRGIGSSRQSIRRSLRSARLNTRVTAFVVGVAGVVRFAARAVAFVVRRAGRVEVDQVNVFDVLAFGNVHVRAFRQQTFEFLRTSRADASRTRAFSELTLNA